VAAAGDADEPRDWAAELELLCERQRYDEVIELARGLLSPEAPAMQQAVAHL